ncbi:hypothetical protein B296_00045258 [Ensete ventricosum]|uniref:Uncharacterized protein n=1 Tax=Ensete ventricosum TaxID=4639 RepID=A0A426XRX0_ENSVE|nr:hypothetical protein B296_00045258 [Ensete ventricosum]
MLHNLDSYLCSRATAPVVERHHLARPPGSQAPQAPPLRAGVDLPIGAASTGALGHRQPACGAVLTCGRPYRRPLSLAVAPVSSLASPAGGLVAGGHPCKGLGMGGDPCRQLACRQPSPAGSLRYQSLQ